MNNHKKKPGESEKALKDFVDPWDFLVFSVFTKASSGGTATARQLAPVGWGVVLCFTVWHHQKDVFWVGFMKLKTFKKQYKAMIQKRN